MGVGSALCYSPPCRSRSLSAFSPLPSAHSLPPSGALYIPPAKWKTGAVSAGGRGVGGGAQRAVTGASRTEAGPMSNMNRTAARRRTTTAMRSLMGRTGGGGRRTLPFASTLQPLSISAFATSQCPLFAAKRSAVYPSCKAEEKGAVSAGGGQRRRRQGGNGGARQAVAEASRSKTGQKSNMNRRDGALVVCARALARSRARVLSGIMCALAHSQELFARSCARGYCARASAARSPHFPGF